MKKLLLLGALVLLSMPVRGSTLTLTQTIPLPDAAGKLDHSALDVAGGRLFATAWAKDSVKVIDLRAGKVVRTINNIPKPQGIIFVPELKRIYIGTEGDSALHVLDAATYSTVAVTPLGEDSDNVRYDPKSNRIFVGYEDGALGIIDAKTNQLVKKVVLKGHPEAFALETRGTRVIMNTPHSHNVTLYDRAADKVVAEWPMGTIEDNFTIALDEANQRAFIGSRKPAFFLVYNLQTGAEIARLPLHGNADDFHYDAKRKQIYASCGEGFIDVYTQVDADHYILKESVATAPGGRTSIFDGNTIYLNVQEGPNQPAEVRCYKIN